MLIWSFRTILALEERGTFLKNCPHLTSKLPIMVPLHSWVSLPYYWFGVKAYDLVSGKGKLANSYFLSKTKALEEFPMLRADTLKGAIVYYDGQQNDTRTNVMLACTAAQYGAVIANHVEVKKINKDNENVINGAVVQDRLSGEIIEIKAKGVINATGPFVDSIRKMDDPNAQDIVVPSSGVHVVLPNYYSPTKMGLLDPATSDGRVIFFLPWQNNTIAGTTDAPTEITDLPSPKEDEISFILNEISHYLSEDISVQRKDVLAAWSGIRPLVKDLKAKDTKSLSRRHVLLASDSKLLTIAGGKWTIYRRMAEDTVDEAIKLFDLKPKIKHSVTKDLKILGGESYSPTLFIKLIQKCGVDKRVAEHLVRSYGDRAFEVAKLGNPTGRRWPIIGVRVSPVYFFIDAEVKYAIQQEYAVTAVDVIARRCPLAFLNASACLDSLPLVIETMAKELKWDEERKKMEYGEAKKFLRTMGLGKKSFVEAEEFLHLRDLFSKVDKDKDGVIDEKEMKEAFADFVGENISDEELHTILTTVQKEGKRKIEFMDFLEVVSERKEIPDHYDPSVGVPKIEVERSGGGV